MAKVLVGLVQRLLRRDDTQLKLLLLFTLIATAGFGDISPMLPLSPMVSVVTSVAGPLCLAAVMGVLIGRVAASTAKAKGAVIKFQCSNEATSRGPGARTDANSPAALHSSS